MASDLADALYSRAIGGDRNDDMLIEAAEEIKRLRKALTQAKLDALNSRPLPPDWLDAVGSGPALDERVDERGQGGVGADR